MVVDAALMELGGQLQPVMIAATQVAFIDFGRTRRPAVDYVTITCKSLGFAQLDRRDEPAPILTGWQIAIRPHRDTLDWLDITTSNGLIFYEGTIGFPQLWRQVAVGLGWCVLFVVPPQPRPAGQRDIGDQLSVAAHRGRLLGGRVQIPQLRVKR